MNELDGRKFLFNGAAQELLFMPVARVVLFGTGYLIQVRENAGQWTDLIFVNDPSVVDLSAIAISLSRVGWDTVEIFESVVR